jgi:thiosulfate/3-mercaptopyruvate sulfurtransferase
MQRESILIEADELLKKLDDKSIRIYDASVADAMYRQGHIPGAAYFDHDRFSDPDSRYMCTILPMDRLVEQIGNAGISNDSEVIVYASGMLPYAIRAWWVLRYAGHNNVRVLNGGLSAWKSAGGEIEHEVRSYEPSVFKGDPRPGMFADKEEVMAALEAGDVSVVDVLPPASYEGSHITGSSNLSCMDLMDGDFKQGFDTLLPNDALALRLKGMSEYKRIITYCGGGIAAAVNAMAHILVGQENVAVYDGSLDEWIGEGLPMTGEGEWAIWEKKS